MNTRQYEAYRPKRKNVDKFIKSALSGKVKECFIKYGVKQRAGFIYGVNIEEKDGTIKQYAVDFNGEKKLVKTIKPENINNCKKK